MQRPMVPATVSGSSQTVSADGLGSALAEAEAEALCSMRDQSQSNKSGSSGDALVK